MRAGWYWVYELMNGIFDVFASATPSTKRSKIIGSMFHRIGGHHASRRVTVTKGLIASFRVVAPGRGRRLGGVSGLCTTSKTCDLPAAMRSAIESSRTIVDASISDNELLLPQEYTGCACESRHSCSTDWAR